MEQVFCLLDSAKLWNFDFVMQNVMDKLEFESENYILVYGIRVRQKKEVRAVLSEVKGMFLSDVVLWYNFRVWLILDIYHPHCFVRWKCVLSFHYLIEFCNWILIFAFDFDCDESLFGS